MTTALRRTIILSVVYGVIGLVLGWLGFEFVQHYFVGALPSDGVQLVLSKDTYFVGEAVQFQVTNATDDTLYVSNQCPHQPLTVERLVSGVWQRVSETVDTGHCVEADRDIAIPAHGSKGSDYVNWGSLFTVPGTYRLTISFDHYRGSLQKEFTVKARP